MMMIYQDDIYPRCRLVLEEPDCRVHFALNCGATSCPLIKEYTPGALDAELELAATEVMEHAQLDQSEPSSPQKRLKGLMGGARAGTLHLSKILDWYGRDFGPSEAAMVRRVLPWIPQEIRGTVHEMLAKDDIKVSFMKYDWTINTTSGSQQHVNQYQRSRIKRLQSFNASAGGS